MAYLREAFAGLGLECVPSWANFILVKVGNVARLYDALLRQGVIVRPVPVYGFPEHVRVTIGTRTENERLVRALARTLGEEDGRGVAV
jgi:histidinol-phosphate aminotransferase